MTHPLTTPDGRAFHPSRSIPAPSAGRSLLPMALLLACGWLLLPASAAALESGGSVTVNAGTASSGADQRKAAEKMFDDIYGAEESAARRTRDPADNMALARKIAADAGNPKLDPVLVSVMREHAVNLLTMLRTSAGFDQAVALREEELTVPAADREAIQAQIVDLDTSALRYVQTSAEQQAGERRIAQALGELSDIQLKKREFGEAIKTLEHIRTIVAAYDPTAAQAISVRIRILQPLVQRQARLDRLLHDRETKPTDKSINAAIVKTLVQDWGDVMATRPYLAAADPDQLDGIDTLLNFEESGEQYDRQKADDLSSLADTYDRWAGDRQTDDLARVILYRKAVQAYTQLALQAEGMDSLRAKQAEAKAQDKLSALEKSQATLLNAIYGGFALRGGVNLSRISSFDLIGVKAFTPNIGGIPYVGIEQMAELGNGSFVGLAFLQGNLPPGVTSGCRLVAATDPTGAWCVCPTVLCSPAGSVDLIPDLDGKSFWVWRQDRGKVTLAHWYFDAARRDAVRLGTDLNGRLPDKYGAEASFAFGPDGTLILTSGETYQQGPRWMINPQLLVYDMHHFGDPVINIGAGQPDDSWRTRLIPTYVDGAWYCFRQDGAKMDQMRWSKLVDGKLVDLYSFKATGGITQLLPGRGRSFHFFWNWQGAYYTSTWDGQQMSDERQFLKWQQGLQGPEAQAYAYGDQVAVLVRRSKGDPKTGDAKVFYSTLFYSQGGWSSETPVAGSDSWYTTYGCWSPPTFHCDATGLTIPLLLGDHDLKGIATFRVSP
ncbi:MAG: hypothetical protein ACREJ2_00665 [Planctomycetota bacterium]